LGNAGYRFVAFLLGLVFLFPLIVVSGRRGLFLPSTRWEAYASVAYWIVTISLLVLTGLLHWQLVERRGAIDEAARTRRTIGRTITGLVVIALPVWTLGAVHGFLPGIVDGPVLERLQLAARYESYHTGGRGRSNWVVVRTIDHGSMRLSVPRMEPGQLPQKGDDVLLVGRRTWLGDRYDQILLDPANCAQPLKRSFEMKC